MAAENTCGKRLPIFVIEVTITHEMLTNQAILTKINDVQEENSDDEENEKFDGEPITKPGIEVARKAIQVLKNFSLFSQFGEAMLNYLKGIDCNIR